MERTKTGIQGFDKLVNSGFPKGSSILISGSPGSGKTIFGLEYLYRGVSEFDENGLYVTFEEKRENVFRQAMQFGWNLAALESDRRLFITCIPSDAIDKSTIEFILNTIKENNILRVIIDSLSTLSIITPMLNSYSSTGDIAIKRFVYEFIYKLSSSGATTLLISHTSNEGAYSIDGVSEFLCDGLITIKFQSLGGDFSRVLAIQKMRSVRNDEDIHPLEISDKGIIIHNLN